MNKINRFLLKAFLVLSDLLFR